jgi:hypothetical protein
MIHLFVIKPFGLVDVCTFKIQDTLLTNMLVTSEQIFAKKNVIFVLQISGVA